MLKKRLSYTCSVMHAELNYSLFALNDDYLLLCDVSFALQVC